MRVDLPASRYQDPLSRRSFFGQLLTRVAALPGIEHAGLVSSLPLSSDENLGSLNVKGKTVPGEPVTAERRWASEGYFSALGTKLVAGRYFEPQDANPSRAVAIVNEAVARRFFPKENALGQQVSIGHGWLTVIGIVGDIRNASPESAPLFQVYMHYAPAGLQTMTLVVRTSRDTDRILASVRRAIATIDPGQSISEVRTMDQLLHGSLSRRRFSTTVVLIFASLALLLTVVGLYSVVTYNVAQRSKEIAVRIALGALWRDILIMILRDALAMAGFGVLIGIAVALLANRFVSGFVYGVPARDPITFCATALLMLVVTAVAAYIPGQRAASTDPNAVLRDE